MRPQGLSEGGSGLRKISARNKKEPLEWVWPEKATSPDAKAAHSAACEKKAPSVRNGALSTARRFRSSFTLSLELGR